MLATRHLLSGASQPPAPQRVFDLTAPDDGGGGAVVHPRAVTDGPVTWVAFIDGEGHQSVVRFDVSTGERTVTRLAATAMEVDDHDNPALCLLDGGGVLAVWALHNGDVFAARSEDGVAWDEAANVTSQLGADQYTYARLERMPDGIHLYLRKGPGLELTGTYLARSVSTDEGQTWSAAQELIEANYASLAREGGRLHVLVRENTGEASQDVRHGYWEDGAFFTSDGTEIEESLPFSRTHLTTVYDNGAGHPRAVGLAVAPGPVALLLEYDEAFTVRSYLHARWTGSAWAVSTVADAGAAPAVEHGAAFADGDPSTVWLCRPASGRFEVFRYRTEDDGATWSGAAVTTGSEKDNLRVFCPRGARGDLLAGWWHGDYGDDSDWDQGVRVYAARGPSG